MSDVTIWLQEIGLGKYAHAFGENDVDFDLLPKLTAEDLTALGLSVGHRRRFLVAAALLSPEPAARGLALPSPAATHFAADAERRHLTVMFCDLVGSTELSQRLDPEELRDLMTEYQDRCKVAIDRYDGYVARYMGDGVLAYFGYPRAHEDDVERAVLSGLSLIDSVKAIDQSGGAGSSPEGVRVRVGIATGLVVAGDLIGEGASQERAVVGETPNLAARLQAIAPPNSLVVSPSTQRLTAGRFEFSDLGFQALKGITDPVQAWQVIGDSGVETRFEAAHGRSFTQLVGREEELDALRRRWARARMGEGQVVLVSAEPGIGKSRLCSAFQETLSAQPHIRLRYQCSPYHVNSAFFPIAQALARSAGFTLGDSPAGKYEKLRTLLFREGEGDAQVLALIADLVSVGGDDFYAPVPTDGQHRKAAIMGALLGQLETHARRQPVLCVFEDVHWIDPSTLELLDRAVALAESLPMLLLVTFRPEFSPPWAGRPHTACIVLSRLSRRASKAMAKSLSGADPLPEALLDALVTKSDGVPLYLEEVTRTVQAGRAETTGQPNARQLDQPDLLTIPASLHDSLTSRLDNLTLGKSVIQAAAVIGREFSGELLRVVTALPEAELASGLEELEREGMIYRAGLEVGWHYVFKHALVRDAAYDGLLRDNRRARHAAVARALEAPGSESTPPELIARHYCEALAHDKALEHWIAAGERSAERAAHLEAVSHYRDALAALRHGEATEATAQREVAIQVKAAASMRIIDKVDDALQILRDAEAMASGRGFHAELAEIHNLLGNLYFPLGQVDACLDEHRKSLRHAQSAGEPQLEARALGGIGDAHYARGRFQSAKASFEQCLTLCRANEFTAIQAAYLPMAGYSAVINLDLHGALELSREGVALARGHALPRAEIVNHIIGIYALIDQGLLEESLAEIEITAAIVGRISARRFEAPLAINASRILLARGDRVGAHARACHAVAIARETSMAFVGPRALVMLAMTADNAEERQAALREAESLLHDGVVAHNQIWFYRDAMDVALDHQAWAEVRRYADALEAFTRVEPLPLTEFFVARGRLLALVGGGTADASTRSALQRLRKQASSVGLRSALPRIDAVLNQA